MITHLVYQLLEKFGVGNLFLRKILAAFIGVMIFGLLFAIVKFTKMEIPNFTRNLILLTALDVGGFFFIVVKQKEFQKEKQENDEKYETPIIIPKNNEESKNIPQQPKETLKEIPQEVQKENSEISKEIPQEVQKENPEITENPENKS